MTAKDKKDSIKDSIYIKPIEILPDDDLFF
jgi:hypothetical protein